GDQSHLYRGRPGAGVASARRPAELRALGGGLESHAPGERTLAEQGIGLRTRPRGGPDRASRHHRGSRFRAAGAARARSQDPPVRARARRDEARASRRGHVGLDDRAPVRRPDRTTVRPARRAGAAGPQRRVATPPAAHGREGRDTM
ncbi:MAG: hypothetical protein AVDCRST_MAG45-984, partial [uncultured Solirubrobacterales bacterium]